MSVNFNEIAVRKVCEKRLNQYLITTKKKFRVEKINLPYRSRNAIVANIEFRDGRRNVREIAKRKNSKSAWVRSHPESQFDFEMIRVFRDYLPEDVTKDVRY